MSAGYAWVGRGMVAALTCGAMLAGGAPAAAGVRPALAAGHIATVAGGAGGPAEVSTPEAVTVDGAGNLMFADTGNSRIREVAG